MALDLWDTPIEVRLIQPGPIDTEIWDQPGNDAALYDGPLEPPSVVAEGIVAAIEGDAFEHYLPDLKGVVEFKTSDIDTFLAGSAEAMRPKRGRRREGAGLRGHARGRRPPPPPDAPRLLQNLATTPMALQDVDDPKLFGPDWAVLRTRMTGICGSDAKQALLDFDSEAGRQPDERLHLVPAGHGPRGGGHRRRGRPRVRAGARPAGRAQPVAVVRTPGHLARSARPARTATTASAGTSTTAASPPASTPATRRTPRAGSPTSSPPTS